MTRLGYDADSEKYFFRDKEGHLWEGQEGAQFGELTRGTHALFNFFQMTGRENNIKLQSRTLLRSPTVMGMTWKMVLGVRMAMRSFRVMLYVMAGSPPGGGRLTFLWPRTAHLTHGIQVAALIECSFHSF